MAAEVGFAFVLLVGAGLLLASFRNLMNVNPGFSGDGVLTASTAAPGARYAGEPQLRTLDKVILAEGYTMKPGESLNSPQVAIITPGYFEAMSMLRGRHFAVVVTTLAAIGLAACIVPARRALQVDPAIVLTE